MWVVAERRVWAGERASRLGGSWTGLGEQQMPLLMEGFGGSIWPLVLAYTSEEQALGTPAHPAWHSPRPEASPGLHLGGIGISWGPSSNSLRTVPDASQGLRCHAGSGLLHLRASSELP